MSKKIEEQEGITRRDLLGGTASAAALAGVGGLMVGGSLMPKNAMAADGSNHANVAPGDLDDYYGFWSSGQAVNCVF